MDKTTQQPNHPSNRLKDNYFTTINSRVKSIKESGADIIRLDIGSPDLPPAPHIVEALSQAARRPDSHGYQSHLGPDVLRNAWATMYQRVHDIKINPDDVVPLMGSKEGIFHLSLALLSPEDVVLVPNPGYLTYAAGASFAGADPIPFYLDPKNGYLPELSAIPLETVKRSKIMWLNYPNNPTSSIATLNFFEHVVEFCKRNRILLCHDAAYTQVTFDGYRAPSILEVEDAADVAVEFNTLSKSHNMAGWRVGAAIGQPLALNALLKLKTHVDSSHFLPVIEASISALTGDQTWVEDRNSVYAERRDFVVKELQEMGLSPKKPLASLYVWFSLPKCWKSSKEFASTLLEQAHVSLAPGTIFGSREKGMGSAPAKDAPAA